MQDCQIALKPLVLRNTVLQISDKINAKQLPAHCKVVHYHTDSHKTDAPP